MSNCDTTSVQNSTISIIQGSDRSFNVNILRKNTLKPFDLTTATEIVACFPNEDGTTLMLSLTGAEVEIVGDPMLGEIKIKLNNTQTAGLEEGEDLGIQIEIDLGADKSIVQLKGVLTVLESLC